VEFNFLISLSYVSTRKNAKKESSSFKQFYFEQKHIITINENFQKCFFFFGFGFLGKNKGWG
jgi:hypothetical protein